MQHHTEQSMTPLPHVPIRKGFTALPIAEQVVAGCILLLVLLLLVPVFLNPAKQTTKNVKAALSKPASLDDATQRLRTFYTLTTVNVQAKTDRLRIGLLGAMLALWLGAAYAGVCVYQPQQTTGQVLRCGGAGTTRALAAFVAMQEHD